MSPNPQLPSGDEYWIDVVGESHYKKNFRKICGDPVDDGEDLETVATLFFEDDNRYDPGNAVRVEIDGYTVGYLPRESAKAWRKAFKRLKTDAISEVPARIRGGWLRDGEWADYGVKLKLGGDEMGEQNIHVTVNNAQPAIIVRSQPGCLLQLVYFVFIGWWLGGLAMSLAYLLMVTVIGIPLGIAIINRMPYLIALRQTEPIISYMGTKVQQHAFLIRALWFLLIGFWLTALWLTVAYACACTIILMPVGFWMFDRAPGVLTLHRK